MQNLAGLVGDVDRFVEEYWGRRPRRAPLHDERIARLFTVADVDRMITSAVRTPAIRLVRDGARVPAARFCATTRIGSTPVSDVADPRKVLDEFRRGATVVLQSLHRTWSPVSAWCADLEADVGWPVQCNAYLTPAGTGGLQRHADGHDVLVVQTFGRKHWDVDGLGEVTIEPGELLYIPAGVDHDAATDEEPSLHLTIGMHRPRPSKIARTALERLELDGAHTTPMPAGGASTADGADVAVADAIGQLTAALAATDPESVVEALRRPPRRHLGGLVAAAIARAPIDDDVEVSLAPGIELVVDRDDDARTRCSWGDESLTVPRHVEPAMKMIAATGSGGGVSPSTGVRLGDLPGLDPESRVVLARRLADEGLLQIGR